MTTSVITASTVGNVEKMRHNRPRHRGTTMESESRMIFTPREKSVYRQLDHARIAAQIGTKLLTDFGGELEFIELRDFVSTMEAHGVINRRVVHDIASHMFAQGTTQLPSERHIEDRFRDVIPFSRSNAEDVAALRAWASGRCIPAGTPQTDHMYSGTSTRRVVIS